MSNNVDRRIVEMQFDNKQFESHAQTSIETLDKLKKSLDLKDSAKGFSELDKAAKSVNLDSLVGAAEAVSSKFSIMGTVTDQVFRRITDAALNAAAKVKGFIEELTIKPVSTGFEEYETQINAIQTIMSNTRDKMTAAGYSEAERLEIVNDRLDQLNHYADKTIYNFTEMTRNIGTFTAAGVELDTAVNSIQGIANLAAVSGSTSEQASRGMYQLSQAISTGTVKLMDWNSVVNAGMGGEVFQKALLRTADAMGVTVDATVKTVNSKGKTVTQTVKRTASECVEAAGSFRDSLSSGWLSAEVLTATLEQFSWDFEQMAKDTVLDDENRETFIQKLAERYIGEGMEADEALAKAKTIIGDMTNLSVEAVKELKKADLLASGYSIEEADEIIALAQDAVEAATKVKTFTQLFDTLKEAAQSGWTQTWEYIIGDFEEAKELLTSISDFFGGIIDASSEARNQVVSGWKDLGGRDELIASFWNIVYTIQNIANVIRGEFQKFFPPKTSEQLYSMTQKFREFTEKLKSFTENSETMEKFRRIVAGVAAAFDLVKKGVSWVWNGFKKLLGVTGSAAGGLLDVAAGIGDFFVNARNSIGESKILQSILTSLGEAATAVKNLFSKAFTKISGVFSSLWAKVKESEILTKIGVRMSEFIGKIPAFIQKIQAWSKAIIDYVKNSETLKKAWNNVKGFFGSTFEKISDFTGKIKEAIREFFSADTSGKEGFWEKLKVRFSAGFSAFSGWFDEAKAKLLETWAKIKSAFATFFTQTIPNFFNELGGKTTNVVSAIAGVDWAKIINTVVGAFAAIKFASFLGSFSKIGKGFKNIGKGLKNIGESLKDVAKDGIKITKQNKDSIGTTLLKIAASIGILVASMLVLSKMDTGDILKSLLVIGALGAELAIIAGIFKAGAADGKSFLMMAAAISLMIIPVKMLAKMDTADALKGIVGIGLIMTEMALFTRIAGKGFSGKTAFLSLAIGINLLVIAVKQLAGMNTGGLIKGVAALGVIFLELSLFTKKAGNKQVKGLISMALALNLMAIAVRSLGKMSTGTLAKGILAIGGVVASFAVLAKTASGMSFGKTLTMLLTIAGTLALFVSAFKEIDGLNIGSMLSFSGSLSAVLLSLAISMKLLGNMPITGALMGVANLAIAIAGISAIIIGLGALKDNWAGMTGLLESGGEVFRLIGNAIGKFIGGIGGGIVDGLDLPNMGTQLSDFMTNAQGFLDGAKNVDESVKTGVGNLTAVITDIAGAEFTSALVGLFAGENPVTRFAGDLKTLGAALSAYGLSILPLAVIPTGLLDKSVSVAGALADVAAKIPPTGGIVGFFSGVGDMSTFSSNLTTLGTALTSFATSISEIDNDKFDQTKIDAVVSVASGLATLEKNLEGQGGLEDAIEGVKSLSKFSEGFDPFGEGVNGFITEIGQMNDISESDQRKLDAVIAIGTALSTLEKNLEAQGGWEDAIEGVKSLSKFSEGFEPFGEGLNGFIDQVRLITYDPNGDDAVKMAAVIAIGESLSKLEKGLEGQGGMEDDFVGIQSLATFGAEMPDFATALNKFIETVSTLEDEKYDQTKINNALAVAQAISDFEAKLPKTDGWWQSVVGNKDLSLFSTNVTQLGTALASFAGDIAAVDMGDSENAISVMGLIGDFIGSLDETGGLWDDIGKWFGGSSENNLLSTTETMAKVGTNLNTFATSLTGISFDGKVDDASKIFTDMETFVSNLDPSGSVWQGIGKVFGKGDTSATLNTIATNMATFGTSIRTFSDGISDIEGASANFETAKTVFDKFKEFGNAFAGEDGNIIDDWTFYDIGEGLADFGTYLSTFATNISGVNVSDLSGAVSTIDTLISIASAAGGIDPTNVQNLAAVLEEYAKTDFSTAGDTLGGDFVTAIVTAIQNGQTQMKTSARQLSSAGSAAMKATYSVWNSVGRYLGSGLASGIAAMASSVRRAAVNAAAGATRAIQITWSVHSPSRVGKDLGMNFDLGIAGGIGEYSRVVSSQATGMGESAVEAAKTMLRGVDSSVFDYLDPNPTIRPVLDLSNVQSGVNAIDGMFAGDPALNTELFRGINVSRNAGMLNFDGAKILGSQSNKDVVSELRALTDKFNTLSESVSNMKLVLDTGVLVGQTSAKMDSQLGVLAARKGRGN